MKTASESGPGLRQALVLAALFMGFCLLLKLPSLTFSHNEWDEKVYWSVAGNLLERGEYSLQGSALLRDLSPRIYDRPLFHHPPLFPVLLLPFVAADAPQAAVILSWAGHLLCILAVALIGHALLEFNAPLRGRFRELFWIPLLGVTTDPVLTFVSRKLWIDSLLTGLIALSLAFVFLSLRSQRKRVMLIAGGVLLGLAALAKLPGLLAGVLAALVIVWGEDSTRARLRSLVAYVVPCAVLVVPWVVVFWLEYGIPLPTWLEPDAFALEHNRFVAAAVARPWHYYVAKLCLVQPLVLLGVALYATAPGRRRLPLLWIPLAWVLLFLVVATYQGASGYGFQMRYLAPLIPAIHLLLYCHPSIASERWSRLGVPLLVLVTTYAAVGGAIYVMTERHAELLSIPEVIDVLGF